MSLLDSDGWPHLITITRTKSENDDFGGHVQDNASAPAASDVPAWVQEAAESVIKQYRYTDQRVTHVVYLESNPGVHLNDDILVSGAPFDGKRFGVRGYGNCAVGFDILFRIATEEYLQTD